MRKSLLLLPLAFLGSATLLWAAPPTVVSPSPLPGHPASPTPGEKTTPTPPPPVPLPPATPDPQARMVKRPAPKEVINAKDGSVLLLVPGGEFTMGSSDEGAATEDGPAHQVKTKAYFVGKYPVTNEQYAKFVRATKHESAGFWDDPMYLKKGGEKKPVCRISWYDAQAYCKWAGLRLLTEAEWEKAARGTDARPYPWGTAWGDSYQPKAPPEKIVLFPVGRTPKAASPYGCLDMVGNGMEWVSSDFKPYPYIATDGRENKPGEGLTKDMRVVRGGRATPGYGPGRTTWRSHKHASSFDYAIGFRVAKSP